MTSTRMTRQDYIRLQIELNALRSQPSVERAGDSTDHDENLIASQPARQARIREIEYLLANAVVDQNAVGNGIAEPGMVLTIRYDTTGQTETFLLGRPGVEDADIKVYSMASPLGSAIAGARPGEQRICQIPDETGELVTLLEAVPYEMHVAKSHRPQSGRR